MVEKEVVREGGNEGESKEAVLKLICGDVGGYFSGSVSANLRRWMKERSDKRLTLY